jgi:hypothetical protein
VGRLALIDDAALGRDWFIAVGQRIYVARRVNTDQLRLIGFAALEGSAAVKTVEDQIAIERRKLQDLRGLDGQAREEKAAQMIGTLQALAQQRLQAMTRSPEQQAEYLRRCNAYICASVHRYGAVKPGVALPEFIHVLPDGTDASTVAVDLRDEEEIAADAKPIYAEPLRFTEDERQHDPANGVLWVHRIPQQHREALGTAIITLHHQATVGEVLPFRGAPGDRRDVPRSGKGVREVAAPGPGADPGANGVQSVVPQGGRRGRGRGGQDRVR